MAVLHINFMSTALGRQVNFTAVIPSVDFNHLNIEEVYNPKRKLKVLWLLHGFSGDENDYLTFTNAARYAQDHQLALIMPPAENSGYTDIPKGAKYFSFIGEELVAFCRYLFPLSDRREDNFIGGLSMGAMGAMKLALAYPHQYSKVVLMSGCAFDLADGGMGNVDWFGDAPQVFGGSIPGGRELIGTREDAYAMLKENAEKHCELPCFYMRVGSKDFLLDKCRYAKAQLETYGYELDYAEIEGYGHEWRFWDLVLNEVISTWL